MTNTDDIDDVLAAADTIDNRLPVATEPPTNWATVEDRIDDVMRNKINELYGAY